MFLLAAGLIINAASRRRGRANTNTADRHRTVIETIGPLWPTHWTSERPTLIHVRTMSETRQKEETKAPLELRFTQKKTDKEPVIT